tara:strand:+ start:440 stop:655 length:216 start_codon:yes stop_codon:yes gene_type:complete
MSSAQSLKSSADQYSQSWQVWFRESGDWGSAKWKKVYYSPDANMAKTIGSKEFPGSKILQVENYMESGSVS